MRRNSKFNAKLLHFHLLSPNKFIINLRNYIKSLVIKTLQTHKMTEIWKCGIFENINHIAAIFKTNKNHAYGTVVSI